MMYTIKTCSPHLECFIKRCLVASSDAQKLTHTHTHRVVFYWWSPIYKSSGTLVIVFGKGAAGGKGEGGSVWLGIDSVWD